MPNRKYLSITISSDDLKLIEDSLNFLRADVIVHAKKHKHTLSKIDTLVKELNSDRWSFDIDYNYCSEY